MSLMGRLTALVSGPTMALVEDNVSPGPGSLIWGIPVKGPYVEDLVVTEVETVAT